MIVTIDTNVLESGVVGFVAAADRAPALLLRAWRAGVFVLALSDHILTELERTLARPYFGAHLTSAQVRGFLALLRKEALIAPITVVVQGVATHPEDDLVLATALSSGADYLVTGDRKLQGLGAYEGVTILSPRQIIDLLDEQGSAPAP
jgi:putative PIN family toxin of toxin-antitoxin system